MKATHTTKTCPMCCSTIPANAGKCAECHHFQNRWALLAFHPVSAAILAMAPLMVMLLFFTRIFAPGAEYDAYKDQVHITDSRIVFGETKGGATVAVLGTIANTSSIAWKEPLFHVEFRNAAGQRIDVETREAYSLRLEAGETSSFKVSFRREFPETEYQQPQVRIISAKDARARF